MIAFVSVIVTRAVALLEELLGSVMLISRWGQALIVWTGGELSV